MDHARFADRRAHGVLDVRYGGDALQAISGEGFWAVVATFEGQISAVRFRHVEPLDPTQPDGTGGGLEDRQRGTGDLPTWRPLTTEWASSLDRAGYLNAVDEVRARIRAGTVYQVNVCRVLTHALDDGDDLDGLDHVLRRGNPAPHAARVRCAAAGLDIVSASPELFLRRRGSSIETRPIKGTARSAESMLPKDYAENVMIVDLMRNDLSSVCEPGSVSVDALCAVERHPGLVHLVSTVSGALRRHVGWTEVFGSTYPAGSVSGAPKSSALTAIRDLEPVPRGPYCGALGWVDADRQEAELAVGIRTFWAKHDDAGRRWLRFGTGAGITWHSDPAGEWDETELKASRLVGLAGGAVAQ